MAMHWFLGYVYGSLVTKIGLISGVNWDDLWVLLVVFGLILACGHDDGV